MRRMVGRGQGQGIADFYSPEGRRQRDMGRSERCGMGSSGAEAAPKEMGTQDMGMGGVRDSRCAGRVGSMQGMDGERGMRLAPGCMAQALTTA